MKEIKLSQQGKLRMQNKVAIVDDEDYERINAYRWHLKKDTNYWYAVTGLIVDGKRRGLYMHRLVLNHTDPKIIIDHKSRDTLDNRKENLRFCDKSHNRRNAKKRINSLSNFIGVSHCSAHKIKKWKASIMGYGKSKFLGYYAHEEDAAKAYDKAAVEIHGEFANLNFK